MDPMAAAAVPNSDAPHPHPNPPATSVYSNNVGHPLVGLEDEPMADAPRTHEEGHPASGAESPPEDLLTSSDSRSPPPTRHGYATVTPHPNAARVLRWVDLDTPKSSDNLLDEPKLFKTGEWLCQLPISHRERVRYFEIQAHKENVPWENVQELYQSVDALPHGPDWSHKNLHISTPEGAETHDVWKRCPVAGTEELIGNRRFDKRIHYRPEQHHRITPDGRMVRVYSDMCTGKWWWGMQDALGPNATIAPGIVMTDATTVTLFTGKKVWPVYMTIANIDKDVRRQPSERAVILIGYLPVPDLSWISDEDKRSQKRWELYHAGMSEILAPLKQASVHGVEMVCADGGVRHVHPILAAHMADFEEQCLAACTQKTRCPICEVEYKGRGDSQDNVKIRTKLGTLQALRYERRGHSMTRQNLGLRPVWPYWAKLPHATGHSSFVPDLLHQIHQGMFKDHLLGRWRRLLSEETVDQRLIGMPRFAGLRHFKVGISSFFNGKWTGNESKEVERVMLPMVAGSQPAEAVGATRCLMDFLYRAHLPQIDDDDLEKLEADLVEFHELKEIFVLKRAITSKAGWDGIPKLHMLSHYAFLIQEYGTPDGYSTELSERLHIDYVKIPYRASNKVDPTYQMITHLQRCEAWAMQRHRLEEAGLIEPERRRLRQGEQDEEEEEDGPTADVLEQDEDEDEIREAREHDRVQLTSTRKREPNHTMPEYHPDPTLFIAGRPTRSGVPAREIALRHEAPGFVDAVKRYVSQLPGGTEHGRLLSEDF
ncbi:hypothetical protein FRC07_001690 [Ceratobasidium sp. 392]|nr:hypothetical protein FRC07_001690 [Ceratobasidium sp. 392]